MKLSARTILVQSLRDFRRTWPQLILTDLLARILGIVVLMPVVGLLLKVFLATTETGVVTDGSIVGFLLHPAGLAALLVVGAVSLGILFAETGQLMVIGFGSIEDRRATWLDALKYAFGRVPALINLAWFGSVAADFVAVSGSGRRTVLVSPANVRHQLLPDAEAARVPGSGRHCGAAADCDGTVDHHQGCRLAPGSAHGAV